MNGVFEGLVKKLCTFLAVFCKKLYLCNSNRVNQRNFRLVGKLVMIITL